MWVALMTTQQWLLFCCQHSQTLSNVNTLGTVRTYIRTYACTFVRKYVCIYAQVQKAYFEIIVVTALSYIFSQTFQQNDHHEPI